MHGESTDYRSCRVRATPPACPALIITSVIAFSPTYLDMPRAAIAVDVCTAVLCMYLMSLPVL
eukprot:COSAG03_NODE_26123_length_261_cov_0.641975_1_plen_62_part_01